jgi:TolA-binding protein
VSELDPQRTEPEDLSAEVRRGHASRSEERALLQALTSEPALRVAHQVGLDFDRETSVRAGDEELILRAADAALARAALPQRRGLRGAPLSMVAAAAVIALCSVTGISAALWVAGVRPFQNALVPAPQVAPAAHAPRKRVVRAQVAEKPVQSAAELTPAPVAPALHKPQPARHLEPMDAAALFHAANSARRAGELARARKLYAELIRQASGSDEAHVAQVSLGKLLVSEGRLSEAERAFQRYLTEGGGALSEEALFHRAECFLRLGRTHHEQLAWRALLAAYPESVYAARARERLASISALGAGSGP